MGLSSQLLNPNPPPRLTYCLSEPGKGGLEQKLPEKSFQRRPSAIVVIQMLSEALLTGNFGRGPTSQFLVSTVCLSTSESVARVYPVDA